MRRFGTCDGCCWKPKSATSWDLDHPLALMLGLGSVMVKGRPKVRDLNLTLFNQPTGQILVNNARQKGLIGYSFFSSPRVGQIEVTLCHA